MTMTFTQGPNMSLLNKTDRLDSSRSMNTLPNTYAAIVDANGVEMEITEGQIRRALEAVENEGTLQFPYGSRSTARGRWKAHRAPARKLHS